MCVVLPPAATDLLSISFLPFLSIFLFFFLAFFLSFFFSYFPSFFPRYRADFALVRTVGAEGEELWTTCLVEVNDGYVEIEVKIEE